MNTAQIMRWRCGNCGISTASGSECTSCGSFKTHRNPEKLRLLSAALSNEGNGYVQNNVNNIAVHGNVSLGDNYIQVEDEDEDEDDNRPVRRQHHSPLASFLMFTSGIVMWMSVLVVGSIFAFFVAVIWSAYVH